MSFLSESYIKNKLNNSKIFIEPMLAYKYANKDKNDEFIKNEINSYLTNKNIIDELNLYSANSIIELIVLKNTDIDILEYNGITLYLVSDKNEI